MQIVNSKLKYLNMIISDVFLVSEFCIAEKFCIKLALVSISHVTLL